jgi:DNA repair exonuclease SbcCD ATPase subunit
MSFKLKSLTVENFVVFVDRTYIDFSNSQINNIEGVYKNNSQQSNGAGKSLIIDAISLALFGKGIRANYISEYISASNPNGGIYIALDLVDENNNILKIERWRRPDSEQNKAKLWRNGVAISQDSTVSKIDEMLQSYIGVTHSNFTSCIFSIMIPGFLKLRPSQRFEILEQALAVKKIESVIKKINASIRLDEEKLEATNKTLIDFNNKFIAENTKKQIYSVNSKSIKEAIVAQEKELSDFLIEEREKVTKLSEYKKLLSDINDKLTPLLETKETFTADLRSLESSKQTMELKLKSVMKAFKKGTGGSLECAICKSSLTESNKDTVKGHYEAEIRTLASSIESKQDAVTQLLAKIDKLATARQTTETAVSTLTRQVSYLQTNILAIEKGLLASKEALKTSNSAYSDAILNTIKKERDNLVVVKGALEKSLKINNAWKHAMSKNGLRLAYIKEEVATLSALASKYASAVYEKPMQVKFYINDDKENPTLDFHVNGKNAGLFSTGEGRRLEIAMTLSLMSLLKTSGLNLGFLILDEALDGLSESSKNAVLKVIDSLASEYQILMISHDPLIKQRPGYVIQVIKDDTVSRSTIKTYTQK